MNKERPTYPLLIESSSNYAFAIKRSKENKTFDFFRNVSTKFYRELPAEIRDELHKSILHGTCMLSSEPELNAYMHDMGKMHNAKLRCAYQNLSSEYSCADVVDIIDYGCGQGLGIIAFADHLREVSVNQQVRRIVLIEPSEMALRRAALHASVLFPNAEIVTINKGFDDLLDGDILSGKDTPTMHILSNVLDLAKTEQAPDGYYDLNRFADLISANIEGKNQFVGVEPLFNNEIVDKKFPYFWKRVGISIDYKLKCNKGEFVSGQNWTCVIVCGEKNNFSSFQKLCKEYDEVGELCDGMIKVARYKLYWSAHCHCNDECTVTEYGFVNESCEEIIPCQYEKVKDFRNGLAFVFDQVPGADWQYREVWGAINKKGQIVIPFEYKSLEWVDDEFILATNENGIIKYDKYGQLIEIDKTRIIEYTSTDGKIVVPHSQDAFGAKIISNIYKDGVGSITFDNEITTLGDGAFYECRSLISIKIPKSATKIGRYAFCGCQKLTEITIPDGVAMIDSGAFVDCCSLKSITFPDSITSVAENVFTGCYNLKAFYGRLASADNRCLVVNGVLKSFAPQGLITYTIPNGITSIENYTFYGCADLISVTIPNSVTAIGCLSFYKCCSLTKMVIPYGITSIGDNAFGWCNNLSNITIPSSVRYIGQNAFRCWCDIAEDSGFAFNGVKSVYIDSLSSWCKISFENMWANPLSYGAKLYLNGVELSKLTIPSDITEIIDYTYAGCSSLTIVDISNKVISIGTKAFYRCNHLENTSIDNSVKEIKESAFSGCKGTIYINCDIPDATFNDNWPVLSESEIWRVDMENESQCENPFTEYRGPFVNNRFSDIIIGENVKHIGIGAFCRSLNLRKIVVPPGVPTIDLMAFCSCTNLKKIYCMAIIPPKLFIDVGYNFYMGIEPPSLIAIYVHPESVSLYKKAEGWNEYRDKIQPFDF